MTEQLSLNLPYRIAYGREAFWVASCNQQAVAWIDKYPDWPVPAVLICGPAGSGKTHLVHLFTDHVIDAKGLTLDERPSFQQKMAVENVDQLANEEAFLHLFNLFATSSLISYNSSCITCLVISFSLTGLNVPSPTFKVTYNISIPLFLILSNNSFVK